MFKNQKNSFVAYVARKMIPVFYAAGDVVISEQVSTEGDSTSPRYGVRTCQMLQ